MFFAGLARGINEAAGASRQEEAAKAKDQADRENSILTHVAQTHPDDDIRALALTGLLNQNIYKPEKGLSGFFGKLAKRPEYAQIQSMMKAGKTVPNAPPEGEVPATLASNETAAMPPKAAVEPGGQPLSPSAAAPPPGPVQFHQEPRQGLMTPSQSAGATAYAKAKGKLSGTLAGINGGGATADPTTTHYAIAHAMGLPASHVDDAQGNRHFFLGNQEVGTAAQGVAKPVRPEAVVQTQIANIMARNPNLTHEEADTLARSAAATTTEAQQSTARSTAETAEVTATNAPAMAAARLTALRNQAVSAYQKQTGTTPATKIQALAAARAVLGNNPDVTPGDVETVANSIYENGRFGGQPPVPATAPPPTSTSATAPPPTAGAGKRGGLTGVVTGAAPDLAAQSRTPKYYSATGKQTILALGTVERLLPKIEATIRQAGLQDSNNPIPEKVAQVLYGLGISPGADMETLLQNAGMSKAYGLRGLLGGRSNQQLQGIYGQHLIDGGDSPKLILQKIHTLQANLPDIHAAVDEAENMRVGGKKGGATTPATPPSGGPAIGERRMIKGQDAEWDGAGWKPVAVAK